MRHRLLRDRELDPARHDALQQPLLTNLNRWAASLHLVARDGLIFRFLNLDHLSKLCWLTRLAFAGNLGLRLEQADQFIGEMRVSSKNAGLGLFHH